MVQARGLAMIIDSTLIFYCFLYAGIYLIVMNFIWEFVGSKLKIFKAIPDDLKEAMNGGWYVLNYVMEFLFYVAVPSIAYSFFYVVLPFEGIKAGLAAAVFALVMGAIPMVMLISVRLKLPLVYLSYTLLGYFIKLAGTMIIIGYLYHL